MKTNDFGLSCRRLVAASISAVFLVFIAFFITSCATKDNDRDVEDNLSVVVLYDLVRVCGYSGTLQGLNKAVMGDQNAYGFVVENGFQGNSIEWLLVLIGTMETTGVKGVDGYTPTIGANQNWHINGIDSGISSATSQRIIGAEVPVDTQGNAGDFYLGASNFDAYIKSDSSWVKVGNVRPKSDNSAKPKSSFSFDWKQVISLVLGALISLGTTFTVSWKAKRSGIKDIIAKLVVELEGNMNLVKRNIETNGQIIFPSPLWDIVSRSSSLLDMGKSQYSGVIKAFIEIQIFRDMEETEYKTDIGEVDTLERTKIRTNFVTSIELALKALKQEGTAKCQAIMTTEK
jgi:hypothetical protein